MHKKAIQLETNKTRTAIIAIMIAVCPIPSERQRVFDPNHKGSHHEMYTNDISQ